MYMYNPVYLNAYKYTCIYIYIYDTTGLDSIADDDGNGDGDRSESKDDGSTNNDVDDSETDKAAVGMYHIIYIISFI